jgi:ADP-dependent NAD(P)H-hydrate dehydratase / NAD(P)H-hydrate epimerase
MEGAAALCSLGAMRAGSGMVRLITLAGDEGHAWPTDVVRRNVNAETLVEVVANESSRAKAMVVGPGLGVNDHTSSAIRQIIAARSSPTVVDADAITAVGDLATLRDLVASATHPVVITPHDGELSRLLDAPLGPDRVASLRRVAEETGAIVLSKGATTVVAAPAHLDPITRLVTAGTPALATAGTGDVLAGVIAAFCARGVALPLAASLGAFAHGTAGRNAVGTLLASDLPNLVGKLLGEDAA